jgi:transcriptional regulator with XRE-family HTH domain
MAPQKRRDAQIAGTREAKSIAWTLGRELRATRCRRRLTQAALGERVRLSQSEISHLEQGLGGRTSVETWVAIGIALERPIAIGFSRDVVDPLPQDAGHLAAQELVVGMTTAAGWRPRFESPSDPFNPRHSTDVALTAVDDRILLVEIWNRLDDLGAAIRSTDRKLADVSRRRAVVGSCWLLVDTAANREIVRRYPAILRARFPGSSAAWVRTLLLGNDPPAEPGLAWADTRGARLRELRLPGGTWSRIQGPATGSADNGGNL